MNHNDYFFNDLKEEVVGFFPSFRSKYSADEQYMLVFELSEYVLAKMSDETTISQLCLFLDRAVEEGGSFTFDVLNIELFPTIYENEQLFDKVKNKTSKNSNTVLDFYFLIRKKQVEINKRILNISPKKK